MIKNIDKSHSAPILKASRSQSKWVIKASQDTIDFISMILLLHDMDRFKQQHGPLNIPFSNHAELGYRLFEAGQKNIRTSMRTKQNDWLRQRKSGLLEE